MKPSFKHSWMIVVALLALTFGALGVTPAHAATIAVTNANDSGAGSLRQAIADAAAGDTITFNGDYTIPLASTLSIDRNLTIDGAGHSVTISGDVNNDATGETRIFYVNTGATFTLQNLTVTKGLSGTNGGGLTNNYGATTTVNNVTFSDNHALLRGGAIQNYSTLTVNNSTFSGNIADTYGGAILINSGTATVTNSTFSNNSASRGGGIFTYSALNLINDTFAGNAAGYGARSIPIPRVVRLPVSTAFSLREPPATTVLAPSAAATTTWQMMPPAAQASPTLPPSCLARPAITAAPPRPSHCWPAPPPSTRATLPPAPPPTSAGFSRAGICDVGAYEYEKAADDFVITVKTDNTGTSTSTQFTIPTYSGETYNYNVDCNNDGVNEATAQTGDYTCNYAAAGTYTVRIKDNTGLGTGFPRIYFNASGDRQKLLTIEQWGKGKWTSMNSAFYGCSNLAGQAADSPDLSGVTDLSYMFRNANVFNQHIGGWDTSHVTNMS